MNYYKHHIGDYDSHTAHLTWLEDAAYSRLIRLYYRREKPIPADISEACRLVRATSRQERDAVAIVLKEFFALQEDGWHQGRCDEEIEEANRLGSKSRTNGSKGGRPKKPRNNPAGFENENPEITQQVSSGFIRARVSITPDTRHQGSTEANASSDPELLVSDETSRPPTESGDPPGEVIENCPHDKIIALYHEILPECPRVKIWTDQRKATLRQRWKDDPDLEFWQKFFQTVSTSKFLTGRTNGVNGHPPFVADLEWLIKPANFAKILEGKYHRG